MYYLVLKCTKKILIWLIKFIGVKVMYDLVIRNGKIVDGSGQASFMGDIAITGDRIVKIGKVESVGNKEIDAEGNLVTPGWVDIHTHYDGQVCWDEYLTPSCWHGVTYSGNG
jgi:N-acyl-D-aspartate/D-glutamate deacylase